MIWRKDDISGSSGGVFLPMIWNLLKRPYTYIISGFDVLRGCPWQDRVTGCVIIPSSHLTSGTILHVLDKPFDTISCVWRTCEETVAFQVRLSFLKFEWSLLLHRYVPDHPSFSRLRGCMQTQNPNGPTHSLHLRIGTVTHMVTNTIWPQRVIHTSIMKQKESIPIISCRAIEQTKKRKSKTTWWWSCMHAKRYATLLQIVKMRWPLIV